MALLLQRRLLLIFRNPHFNSQRQKIGQFTVLFSRIVEGSNQAIT